MTAILASDVFPGLDKKDPLESKEEDVVPEKYVKNSSPTKVVQTTEKQDTEEKNKKEAEEPKQTQQEKVEEMTKKHMKVIQD